MEFATHRCPVIGLRKSLDSVCPGATRSVAKWNVFAGLGAVPSIGDFAVFKPPSA